MALSGPPEADPMLGNEWGVVSAGTAQMCEAIADKTVINATCAQPKCLNVSPGEFSQALIGKTVGCARPKGKWNDTALLIHLGMGGNLVYRAPNDPLPAKWQLRIDFADHSGFTCRPWWFGYFHIAQLHRLDEHPMVGALGPSPLDEAFTLEIFRTLVRSGHGCVGVLTPMTCFLQQESIRSANLQALLIPKWQRYTAPSYQFLRLMNLISTDTREASRVCGSLIAKIKTGRTNSFTCPSCYRHGISEHHDPIQI